MPRSSNALPPVTSKIADADVSFTKNSEGRYAITVACERLREDGEGGIVEAPDVLKHFGMLRERISRLLQGKSEVMSIVAYPGRYEFDVLAEQAQGDLLAGRNIRDLLVPPLEYAVKIIEGNAKNTTPKTAAELGVSPEVMQVECTLAAILGLGLKATIQSIGGDDSSPLPAVDRDALSAIAREPRPRQRITGIVTGLGLEPDGLRIEVNRGVRPAIAGMTIETALPFLLRPTQVTGYLIYDADREILDEPVFGDSPESGTLGF